MKVLVPAPRHHALKPRIESVWACEGVQSRRERAIPAGAMHLAIRVDDADAVIARAVAAGAKLEREPADAFTANAVG